MNYKRSGRDGELTQVLMICLTLVFYVAWIVYLCNSVLVMLFPNLVLLLLVMS